MTRMRSVDLEPLLLEIGCEEIPARMIPRASADLAAALVAILDAAGLDHGSSTVWGGSRRLAVRIDAVAGRQADRDETVLGPANSVAFDRAGSPTRAALGFAAKHGIEPTSLTEIRTDRGTYVGFERRVAGRDLGEVLAEALPVAVSRMSFPKTMRWGEGVHRWVRPVHWVVALHGPRVLALSLFGVTAGRSSVGHRFLASDPVVLAHADEYTGALERAHVLADPGRRRATLARLLDDAGRGLGGALVQDPDLLDEVADLVEWPGVVPGAFDPAHLELPREILVTTLRHHQKCFSVDGADGALVAGFLAIANTDRDPGGHVRRGNEWVVGGRLDDARFFWTEDRATSLSSRSADLAGVAFHARSGTYADKAERLAALARAIAERIGLDASQARLAAHAARLAKNDLSTGLVGEFPELQGIAGGLLLRAEGEAEAVATAVYEHYRPAGPDDPLPATELGAVVAVADKLDNIACLMAAGEKPSGSRDPFGLRRAGNGVVRILLAREWPVGLGPLCDLARAGGEALAFLGERMSACFRDAGFSTSEIHAVLRPRLGDDEPLRWPLADVRARLEAVARVRGRDDFRQLVQLTERVDRILSKNVDEKQRFAHAASPGYVDSAAAARVLAERVDQAAARLAAYARDRDYAASVESLAEFIDPVERFFVDCLVIDSADPSASASRFELLARLGGLLTCTFDVRELAGEAERSP